jgi:hypothetical protein
VVDCDYLAGSHHSNRAQAERDDSHCQEANSNYPSSYQANSDYPSSYQAQGNYPDGDQAKCYWSDSHATDRYDPDCLGANEQSSEISWEIGVVADQVAGGQDVRRPPEQRAKWCNTALLIYRENSCQCFLAALDEKGKRAVIWSTQPQAMHRS